MHSMTTVSKRLPRTPKPPGPAAKSAVKNAISSRPATYRSKSVGSLADRRIWQKGVRYLKRSDPILARIIDRVGPVKFELDDDHYEVVVGSIIFQQLTGSNSSTVEGSQVRENTCQLMLRSCVEAGCPRRKSPTSRTSLNDLRTAP